MGNIRILAVDDEELNRDIMCEYFEAVDFAYVTAVDGVDALNILEKDDKFDVIVLDRMMPNMDGMEFLKRVKQHESWKSIPVIMQTAASANYQIAEGLNAGVYYYLSKPYTKDVFLAIIRAAYEDTKRNIELRLQVKEFCKAMSMVQNAEFKFQSVEEAKVLSVLVGSFLPNPDMMIVGLTELAVNAVEHGNLGITYQEKSKLKIDNNWESEIERRLHLPENNEKHCVLCLRREEDDLVVNIKDQGMGFDWERYMAFDPSRLMDPNGRGIMMTMNSGFASVSYKGNGSEVECRINMAINQALAEAA
jgi:CheY-like chemotaxis protein